MKRVRRIRLPLEAVTRPKKARGQSLVEFALISIILFAVILGIIEMGRLMYVYSAVSNAAQEGSRYAITRPRDFYTNTEAARRILQGTVVPTYVVVANGGCNIVDKTREKVVGVPRNDVEVNITFDNGNGTPTAVPLTLEGLNLVTVPNGASRIAVEASYQYQFMTPFFSVFAPSGITIRMRSARTILRFGEEAYTCAVNYTPAPTRTAVPTSTHTPTRTATATYTPTSTRTSVPPTNTSIPPTATRTSIPPSPTRTSIPPTVTRTSVPPTVTRTSIPPTVTPTTGINIPSPVPTP